MILDNCNHCVNNWGVDIDEEYEDEEDEEE